MATKCLRLFRNMRTHNINNNFNASVYRHNFISTSVATRSTTNKEFLPPHNTTYLDDPDVFGTLSRKIISQDVKEDEGDIKEEKYLQEMPLKPQKLTTKQYADLMKQYIKHKRLKEAIDVLEVRMIQEDRVKPENYIYNILIGACADVGYTKKAFKLYNDMKKRALKPTGDTYTCLFTACLNSPWLTDGLKNATHLRELMIEKGIEPNLTNYNVMIKTFGRCGDLPTAFAIVDEMVSKKIKIRVHTLNHLLHACISDKDNGLRHALIVWRKMLKMREKPNIYSFNLMLRCVKECNLGNKEDINELITIIEQHNDTIMGPKKLNKPLQIVAPVGITNPVSQKLSIVSQHLNHDNFDHLTEVINCKSYDDNRNNSPSNSDENKSRMNEKSLMKLNEGEDKITMELVDYKKVTPHIHTKRSVPNLLSRNLQMDKVFAVQDVHTVQDKFAMIGGQEDFLKELESYGIQPDIKLFTQMLPLIEDSTEAEMKLVEAMQAAKVKADIDFYNMLIKKRCLRLDYEKAFEVKDMIENDRKKRHPWNKKHELKANIMTYGVLALACSTKESAEKLLNEMEEKELKINIQILGTLLKNGIVNNKFGYVVYIMNMVKEEKVKINDVIIKHLEGFTGKCESIIKQNEKKGKENIVFESAYKNFIMFYEKWLPEVNATEALKPEHPWHQFRENYPETVQRMNIEIKQPKKFYKRNRKYVPFAPQVK